jgi:hypothetical protein
MAGSSTRSTIATGNYFFEALPFKTFFKKKTGIAAGPFPSNISDDQYFATIGPPKR